MKRLFLISTIFLMSGICFAQTEKITEFTDIDIASAIIAKDSADFEEVIKTFDLDYWITDRGSKVVIMYISYNNSVRLWEVHTSDILRTFSGGKKIVATNIVNEVFIRYRHSNLNDLHDFNSYDKPDNSKFKIYEKKAGAKLSHLRVLQK